MPCLKQMQPKLVSLQKRKSSCEHTDGRRKARTDSIHAVKDQQLHETRGCSSSHSLQMHIHSTHAHHTETRLKIAWLNLSSCGSHIRSWERNPRHHRQCHDEVNIFLTRECEWSTPIQKRLSRKLSGTSRIPLWAGCRTLTSTGLGISSVCPTTKVGVRAERRTTCVVGVWREELGKSRMENLRSNPRRKDESTDWQLCTGQTETMGARGVHNVWCSECAELSSKNH